MTNAPHDLYPFEVQLNEYINDKNRRLINDHIRLFKGLIERYPFLHSQCLNLVKDIHSLFNDDYWLKLEVIGQSIKKSDDILFRRCLFNFAKTISNIDSKPSAVVVSDTEINLLDWYRRSLNLGKELHDAIYTWSKSSKYKESTKIVKAQNAIKGLSLLCDSSHLISEQLYENGLSLFNSTLHFNKILSENNLRKYQSSLLSILQANHPNRFLIVTITINNKKIDVNEIYDIEPVLVEQLQKIANSKKYKGDLEHSVDAMEKRFRDTINTLKILTTEYKNYFIDIGLDGFKTDDFALLKICKSLPLKKQFAELLLLLELHFEHPIHRDIYTENLISFYFKKENKYRYIDYNSVAQSYPNLMKQIYEIHKSETELLIEKNYDIETLHTRFAKLKRLICNYIALSYNEDIINDGLKCLSKNNNLIQRSLLQKIQGEVKANHISLRTGTSYVEVIRWVMSITNQKFVDVYKISFKRYQRHAKRTRMEDLYTDNELKELIYYIEKGIKNTYNNPKQLLSLYFARIQIKSCWNTSPMTDIELSDIVDVELPTTKNSITLLIQKPRKGYDIDTYSLDGQAINSVMRDILYVKNVLTQEYRPLCDENTQQYLFIFKEKNKVSRISAKNIIIHIKMILNRLGCSVDYDSMRIRKSGANHLYREVSKQMSAYESVKLHTFDTFIKHYQRVSEQKTQQTLHTAVDVMQRYFTGREIDPEIRVLMIDDGSTQRTPTGECASQGDDAEARQYNKEHRHLSGSKNDSWCSDFLACIWCKHFRTVADPEHVWQLLSYRDYVLADMSASISDIDNNEFQQDAITVLHQRVDSILNQISEKNPYAVAKGKNLILNKGIHPFWEFAVTSVSNFGENL